MMKKKKGKERRRNVFKNIPKLRYSPLPSVNLIMFINGILIDQAKSDLHDLNFKIHRVFVPIKKKKKKKPGRKKSFQ